MFLTCNYYSFVMKHNIDVNVIIPTPEGNEQITDASSEQSYAYESGLPVVYLLHGAYGNQSSWTRFSSIERYAQKHRCVMVTAAADNSFYQDMVHGPAYHKFFTEELPVYITRLFPVSSKREDTYVAGFSMGGYGAWYLALSRPDLYSKAASMSGALDIAGTYASGRTGAIDSPFPWTDIFKDPEKLEGSDADLFHLYDQCVEKGQVPQLYQACGTEDFLYQMNQSVRERMAAKGADVTYEEGPGGHNWDFWDQYIQRILDWMLP